MTKEIKKERNSNFELMRIISMFMIVLWHCFIHAFNFSSDSKASFVVNLIECLLVIHVNSFVLLSGYFQSKSRFKFSKLISLNNSVWFYKSVEYIIFLILGIASFSIPIAIDEFFPLDLQSYWYIRVYLMLYLISPFLNKLINNINQNYHKKLIIVLFILCCIIAPLTRDQATYRTLNMGYSLINFIMLYFIRAYLQFYPINKSHFGLKYTRKMKKLIFLILYITLAFINFSINNTAQIMLRGGDTMRFFGNILKYSSLAYNNPIIVIQTICYFMIFYYMNFKSKIINYISSLTFGIYLIHENHYFRSYGYKLVFKDLIIPPLGYRSVLYSFIVAIIIFVLASIIELIRKNIFKFIYNRKISTKFRYKYRKYISDLGININW